jgi:hypothetical protein
MKRVVRQGLVSLSASLLLAGCVSTTAPRFAILTGVSGSGQVAAAGTLLPEPFVVRVEDQSGQPVEGFVVTWEVTAGNGTVTEDESPTDSQGLASTTLQLGAIPGINRVRASIGSPSPVVFTATGTVVTP